MIFLPKLLLLPVEYSNTLDIILNWVKDAGLEYTESAMKNLDVLIVEEKKGIMIVEWKKPISIRVLNTAICILSNPEVEHLFIVCQAVSKYVRDSITRSNLPIKIIHPFGLTDLAIEIHKMYIKHLSYVTI